MKAAVVTELGRPPRYTDFPDPQPTDGAVTASVVAASLKNLDRGLVSGKHYGSASVALPSVAGVDGVVRLADGTLAYSGAISPNGLMAQQTLVHPAGAVPIPVGVDPVLAAAVPNPGVSAWFSLEYAGRIQPGQNVLVLGATGVTGSVAVQLAKSVFGAGRVVAVGRNRDRLDWLSDAGADAVIPIADDLTERVAEEHRAHPIDVVLDYLWGNPAEQVLAALANTGLTAAFHATRYVEIGAMAGLDITLPAAALRSAGIELVGVGIGSVPAEAQARVPTEILPRLFAMTRDGSLRIETQAHPLSEVERLWTAAEPSGVRVVLVP